MPRYQNAVPWGVLHSGEEEEVIWSNIWLVNGVFHDRFLVQNLAVCVGVCCGYTGLSGSKSDLTQRTRCLKCSRTWRSGWQSDQVRQTVGAVRDTNVVLTVKFNLPWGGVSLESSIACSAALSLGHAGNPSVHPQWWICSAIRHSSHCRSSPSIYQSR
jgi:hypothetical protein